MILLTFFEYIASGIHPMCSGKRTCGLDNTTGMLACWIPVLSHNYKCHSSGKVTYSTVALVPPMSTMDVWHGIT